MIDALARISRDPDSFARLLSEMNGAGIDRAVLFPEDSGVPARLISDFRKRDPKRFAVVAAVDPLAGDASRAIEDARFEWGAVGVEMTPEESGRRWLNIPSVMPLWEKLEALGIRVSLCIASQNYNQFSDVVTSFPRLRIVLEDLGSGPGTMLSQYVPILLEYARYPQVYVSISRLFRLSSLPYPYTDLWPVLEEIRAAFGPDRLVWGSGYPEVLSAAGGYGGAAGLLRELPFFSPADRDMIQDTNAARLWFD
ncbi:MAG: amidohydrolase family protein [Acidobacteriota bacterium]